MTRIFQFTPLVPNSQLILDEKASHHLSCVLRRGPGDELFLFNGDGLDYKAHIIALKKKQVVVDVEQGIPVLNESPVPLYLAQGIARGAKMDMIVQKAVELGVKKIFPLLTERANAHLKQGHEEKRLSHWRSVAISACEQSGRAVIPEIASPMTLASCLNEMKADITYVLSPHLTSHPLSLTTKTTIALLIGPEGGFSDREMEYVMQKGCHPLNLGPRILRTETATIAALSILEFYYRQG